MECESVIELVNERDTLRERVRELENRYQADSITINQLNVALDVITEKYARLRRIKGL